MGGLWGLACDPLLAFGGPAGVPALPGLCGLSTGGLVALGLGIAGLFQGLEASRDGLGGSACDRLLAFGGLARVPALPGLFGRAAALGGVCGLTGALGLGQGEGSPFCHEQDFNWPCALVDGVCSASGKKRGSAAEHGYHLR